MFPMAENSLLRPPRKLLGLDCQQQEASMALSIVTNNRFRDFVYRSDVPEKVLADQFDHMSEEDGVDGFFQYRGYWYHLSDFMGIENNPEMAGWQGYSSDSAFSGVLICVSRDGESVKVGRYYS
jgi:hypothetical protein